MSIKCNLSLYPQICEISLKKSISAIVRYKVYISSCSITFKKKRTNSNKLNPSSLLRYTLSIDYILLRSSKFVKYYTLNLSIKGKGCDCEL